MLPYHCSHQYTLISLPTITIVTLSISIHIAYISIKLNEYELYRKILFMKHLN